MSYGITGEYSQESSACTSIVVYSFTQASDEWLHYCLSRNVTMMTVSD